MFCHGAGITRSGAEEKVSSSLCEEAATPLQMMIVGSSACLASAAQHTAARWRRAGIQHRETAAIAAWN
jgi:hypothetical protein